MTGGLFAAAAALVVAGWLGYRRRMRALREELSDAEVRRIEASGRLDMDEPLDLEEAADEEARFWNESWDEPEPY